MMLRQFCFAALVALSVSYNAAAQKPDPAPADAEQTARQFVESLHFQTGTVSVPKANATLKLTPDFRFLAAHDAQRVLEQLWGNPPDSDVLGLLVPTSSPLDEKGSWAVVVTYSNDGYVSDADASKIDYTKMMQDMQDAAREANAERTKQGYPSVDIIGWATPPHYDVTENKIYWAKELAFGGAHEHTLNYDIRVLGRGGYLSLNAVAGMSQLPLVQAQMPKVLAMTQFDSGQRYSDFNASTDKVAAYGIAALVAGAFAAKAGLFAKLFVMLLALKKFLIVGLVAIGAAIRKLFARKSS
jgi:uncharacterized membrane-anchored protein